MKREIRINMPRIHSIERKRRSNFRSRDFNHLYFSKIKRIPKRIIKFIQLDKKSEQNMYIGNIRRMQTADFVLKKYEFYASVRGLLMLVFTVVNVVEIS